MPPILPLYPRLTPRIFIADRFQTIIKASSIIFELCQQIFAEAKIAKIFELERLWHLQSASQYYKNLYFHILFYVIRVLFCSKRIKTIQAIKSP